jgi:hypothetical protein
LKTAGGFRQFLAARVLSSLPNRLFSCRVKLECDMFGENGIKDGEMNFIYIGPGPVLHPPSHINVTDNIPCTLPLNIIYTYHFPNFYIELSDVNTRARVRRRVLIQKILQSQQNKKQGNVLYISNRNQGVVMYHKKLLLHTWDRHFSSYCERSFECFIVGFIDCVEYHMNYFLLPNI